MNPWKRNCLVALFSTLTALVVYIPGALAQYGVGQRVVADVGGGGDGTIIEVGHGIPYEGYDKVHFDKRHHYDPKAGDWIEIKSGKIRLAGQSGSTVSATPGLGASPVAPASASSPAAVSAVAKSCACRPSSEWSGNSIEAKLESTIAARYVRNGGALDSEHTPSTVHFDSFAITGTRPYATPIPGAYQTGSPGGPGGRVGTKVYLVTTKYSVCIDYPGFAATGYKGRVLTVDHDARYTCFIDSTGQWRCNQSADKTKTTSVNK